MTPQDELKQNVARAALDEVRPFFGETAIIGVGTGSTADFFIDALATQKGAFRAAVASSERTASRLAHHGIPTVELNDVLELPVYVDGADEIDGGLRMIKGGGGALTREKIVAAVAKRFICIADASKRVAMLGKFPLPIEVIPMAQTYVSRELVRIAPEGSRVQLRQTAQGSTFVTDNGNVILDVHGWMLEDPLLAESQIGSITGVVTNGIFAFRGADLLLLGTEQGVNRCFAEHS